MRRADVQRLRDAAAAVAARDRAALSAMEARAAPIRAALAALDADALPDVPTDLRAARDQAAWTAWRMAERQRLMMELSRLRAELDGLRRAAAKAAAREAVAEKIADRLTGRGGRSR